MRLGRSAVTVTFPQHLPIAQHRRFLVAWPCLSLRAALAAVASWLTQAWTSRMVSRSSRLRPAPGRHTAGPSVSYSRVGCWPVMGLDYFGKPVASGSHPAAGVVVGIGPCLARVFASSHFAATSSRVLP